MFEALKTLLKQPYWIIALILGGFLVSFPCITIGKDHDWITHAPTPLFPVIVGVMLLLISVGSFAFVLLQKPESLTSSSVKEKHGELSIITGGCEIRIVEGRIEEHTHGPNVVVVLPCNEYFDDLCVNDIRSALGAYAGRVFGDQIERFVALAKSEAGMKFGQGTTLQKTKTEVGSSFGSGKCLLLQKPLDRPNPIALISTTTQRAEQGLAAQISYLFEGIYELNKCLADARINEAVTPVLGGGHGGIYPPFALMSLILAMAETARYGRGAQRLKNVTIVVFKKDDESRPEIEKTVVRSILELIGSQP